MGSLGWDDLVEMNVPEMDAQHHELARLFAELEAQWALSPTGPAIGPLLLKLGRATRRHFASEEDYLTRRGFPGLERHLEAHAVLVAELETWEAMFRASGELDERFFAFVSLMVHAHIMGQDAEYRLPPPAAGADEGRSRCLGLDETCGFTCATPDLGCDRCLTPAELTHMEGARWQIADKA